MSFKQVQVYARGSMVQCPMAALPPCYFVHCAHTPGMHRSVKFRPVQDCAIEPKGSFCKRRHAQDPAMHGHSLGCPDAEQGAWQINTAKAASMRCTAHLAQQIMARSAHNLVLSKIEGIKSIYSASVANMPLSRPLQVNSSWQLVSHRGMKPAQGCSQSIKVIVRPTPSQAC